MSSAGQHPLQRYAWLMAELAGGAPRSEQATVGDAFAWASHDPGWIGKVILMGLIGLIPIVGPLQQAGWMLAALDNLRAGRHEVPPAAFRYASRGVWLFLAALVYAVVVGVVFYGGVFALAFGLSPGHSTQQSDGSTNQLSLVFFPLTFAFMGFFGLVFLASFVLVPLIIEFTDRTGFGGAFNFAGFARAIRTSPQETLAAGGLALVSYFISGIGTYLCYVGLLFTAPYALTVLAGHALVRNEGETRHAARPDPPVIEGPVRASTVKIGVEDPATADARWCIEQYFSELNTRFEAGFDPSLTISADADELVPPAGMLLIARLRGRPVGCGALKFHTRAPAELKRMWVAPEARGLGLGRRLLVELERHAKRAGARRVRLETNRSLKEAIQLYRSSGYREVPAFNDEPFAHHWFEKRIS